MKYYYELFLSIITSLVFSIIAYYFTNNIVVIAAVFTASLVTIQFLLNRYENRMDVIVEMGIEMYDDKNGFFISIKNNGGKTLYLNSGGIITKEGIIVDFDDKVEYDGEVVEKQKIGFLSLPLVFPKMPKLPQLIPNYLNPGQSKKIRITMLEFLSLLRKNNWQFATEIEIKGFFKDQLDRTYKTSQFDKYDMKNLFELAGIKKQIK
jgi:hypothetical protein